MFLPHNPEFDEDVPFFCLWPEPCPHCGFIPSSPPISGCCDNCKRFSGQHLRSRDHPRCCLGGHPAGRGCPVPALIFSGYGGSNQDVQLRLADGKRILIGSQRAEEFARAIAEAKGQA